MKETLIVAAPVTIRDATAADLPALVQMGVHFIQATAYRDRFADPQERARGVATTILDHGTILVAETEGVLVGMIGLLLVPHFIMGRMVGTEIVWWVEPSARSTGAGRRLLRAAEDWSRVRGAQRMQFGAFRDARLERLYRALGYEPCEVIYEKDL